MIERMNRLVFVMIAMCAAGACGGGDKGGVPDANPNAPLCTGVVYDNCVTDAQCMSGMCKLFAGEFQVCSQACTAGEHSTCPQSMGGTPKCNNRGLCKPAQNNNCRPPS